MMNVGISREALQVFCQLNSEITEDLPYGRILRRMVMFGSHYGLLDSVIRLSQEDPKLRAALFNCVSGHKSFKAIWRETRDWRLLAAGIKNLLQGKRLDRCLD